MKKVKLEIEYLLKNVSQSVLWNAIGTPLGLSEWFADGITVDGDEYTFVWDKNEQTAQLTDKKPNVFIRFQWNEDAGSVCFFEMKIIVNQLTGELSLFVTDFTQKDEKEDLILLWNHQIDVMKRKNGL